MDDLQRSLLNVFTNSDLDRMVQQREDSTWVESVRTHHSTRYILFSEDRFLLTDTTGRVPVYLTHARFQEIQHAVRNSIFLGSRNSTHYFAADLTDSNCIENVVESPVRFGGLRGHGWALDPHDASMLSFAKTMFHWHRAHEYCGICGSATQSTPAGHVRKCTNSDCGKTHFPRTDPAIIVAVIKDSKCLFGRQSQWPKYRHSVIAGFVEPGESIEQAVVREVQEETNIILESVKYHSSQPWPFPGSIMLGFMAQASTDQIVLNDCELENAHWRSVEQVIEGLESELFLLPPKLSIAYRLIEDWFNSYSSVPLASLLEELQMCEKHRV